MDDLIERLRHLSSRRVTAEFRNALKEAADALERARNDALEEAARCCEGAWQPEFIYYPPERYSIDPNKLGDIRKHQVELCAAAIRVLRERMKSEKFAGPVDQRRLVEHIDELFEHANTLGMRFAPGAKEAALTAARDVVSLDCSVSATLVPALKPFIIKFPA